MYNTIAYISFFIVYIAMFVGIGSFFLYELDKDILLLLGAVIFGFGQIYDRAKTKPISQAIKDFWNKNKNSENSQNNKPKTYEEYKKQKSKDSTLNQE